MSKITQELKDRLAKVYKLTQRGGTEGEKAAAQALLDRLLAKYELEGVDLDTLEMRTYAFTYKTALDEKLMCRLVAFLFGVERVKTFEKRTYKTHEANGTKLLGDGGVTYVNCREFWGALRYLEYVELDAMYEYFRRHMKTQWDAYCAGELSRKRKASTRNKRRAELIGPFFNIYVLRSGIVRDEELKPAEWTDKEKADLYALRGVQGGTYSKQVVGGLFLEGGGNG